MKLKDFTDLVEQLNKYSGQRTTVINTGLLGMNLMEWTILSSSDKSIPRYWTETYKRRYGIVQISIGKKWGLEKIIVDMREQGYKKYSIRFGTKEVAKASDFISAIKYFKK